jgi:hypothetical protein
MIEDEGAIGVLRSAIRELSGMRVWEPKLGFGSFITINFGGTWVNPFGVTLGEYYLWVFDGRWSLRHGSVLLATSDDPRPTMERAVAHLDGEAVVEADFDPAGPSLAIRFTGDLVLQIDPTPEPDMEHWILFLPDGFVIESGPGHVLVHESAGR